MTRSSIRQSSRLLPVVGLLSLAGCQALGVLLYKAAGEPDVPAQYELPQKTALVLVENFRHASISADDADLLSRLINAKLAQKNLVPLVGPEKLIELKSAQPAEYRKMTVVEIAQKFDAEQVIYVHLQSGGVTSMGGGSVKQGKASVLVRVIDVSTGENAWPTGIEDGRLLSTETNPATVGTKPESEIRLHMYDDLAFQVVRLFYKWKPDSSDAE
jgi:hypothetical protein